VNATTVHAAANRNEAGIGEKAIACARIATGIIFFLFAEYKIAGSEFTPVGFEHWVGGWVEQGQVVGFYKPVLVNIALGHPVFCARLVAWGELGIAASLILGLLVRPAAIGGVILMINFILSNVVCARAWCAGLAIFRRESGSYPAAISLRDFLCDAGGGCLGARRAFAADAGPSGIGRDQVWSTFPPSNRYSNTAALEHPSKSGSAKFTSRHSFHLLQRGYQLLVHPKLIISIRPVRTHGGCDFVTQSIFKAKDHVCRQGFEKRRGAENGQPVTDVRQHQQYEDLKGGHLVTIRLG
jgi:uncharacterized membrane protein YphA (DoxX/SURF4 family)